MGIWLTLFCSLTTVLVGLVTLGRKTVRPRVAVDEGREVGVLAYSLGMKWVLRTCALLTFVAMVMASLEWPFPIAEGQRSLVVTLFLLLALCGVLCGWETRTRAEIDQEGVAVFSAWRGRVSMAWHDVRSVIFRGGVFVLRKKGGDKVRINGALNGIDTLIKTMCTVLTRKVRGTSISDYNELKRRENGGKR